MTKKGKLGRGLAAATLLGLAATATLAQGVGAGDRPGLRGRTPMGQRWIDGGDWWNDPAVAEQLGLPEETRRKIEDEVFRGRREMIDLRAEVEKQTLALERVLSPSSTASLAAVESQVDELVAARGGVLKSEIMLRARIMALLTPEQRVQLEEIHQERRRQMRERVLRSRPQRPGGPGEPPPPE